MELMNKILLLLLIYQSILAYSAKAQDATDSLFAVFVNSELFNEVIVPEMEAAGYEIFTIFGKDTLVSDFGFQNIYNNEFYIIRESGIWEIGVVTSHRIDSFLFFKYNNRYYIENSYDFELIMKRFNWFSNKAKLTKEEKIIYLFGLVKVFNSCYDYPVDCIQNCYKFRN